MSRPLSFDPSREPLPPDEELWGSEDSIAPREPEQSPAHDALDASLRALARESYHVSGAGAGHPDTPHRVDADVPREAMWAALSAQRQARRETPRGEAAATASAAAGDSSGGDTVGRESAGVVVHALAPRQSRRFWPAFAALAATLVAGVVIGRGVDGRGDAATDARTVADAGADAEGSEATRDARAMQVMLAELTSQHFASTEALLVTARQEMSGSPVDASVAVWARDLLLSTRLLLDTESLRDVRTRRLLEDLELTLALIVQAQSSGRDADAQTVRDDLERGDLLLRVRGAAMPTVNSPNDIRGMSE